MKRSRIYTTLAGLLLALLLLPGLITAADIPKLSGRINDYAGLLDTATASRITAALEQLEKTDSTQVVVLTVPSLEGIPLEEYALRTAQKWQLGQKDIDNWALLLIALNDRKIRIEVGYGLEGKLTDLMSGRIIRSVITPQFQKGNFAKGIEDGTTAMIGVVSGEYAAEDLPKTAKSPNFSGFFPFVIFFLFFLGNVFRKNRAMGGVAGAVVIPLLSILLLGGVVFPLILLLIPGGFLGGYLATLFGTASTHSGSHTGSYGGGGFGGGFGSGFGGGGFGGGGFSGGGGGGGGGGGASGGW